MSNKTIIVKYMLFLVTPKCKRMRENGFISARCSRKTAGCPAESTLMEIQYLQHLWEGLPTVKKSHSNKSHYQDAEAVFLQHRRVKYEKWAGGKSANDKKETDRWGEGVGCETASNRDEKQRRVRGPRRYDNTFTIEPNQFPFLTSFTPADD